jgi:hypothetical protein
LEINISVSPIFKYVSKPNKFPPKIPLSPLIGFPLIREDLFQRLVSIRISPINPESTGRIKVTEEDTYLNISMNYEVLEGTNSEDVTSEFN